MKQPLAFALLLLSPLSVFAQKKIETDRPSETQSTKLAPKGYLQVETGFAKQQQNDGNYSVIHPDVQIRYGLFKRLELRAELLSETDKLKTLGETHDGLEPVELGVKAQLWKQKKWLPEASFYTQVGIPNWAGKEYQQEHLSPEVRLLFQNKITKWFTLAYNAGAEWSGGDEPAQWLYTLSPQFSISDKWEAFLETFAYLQKGEMPLHHIDGGLAFYPSRNIKLDLWGGKSISEGGPDYFISAGVSFRLKP